MELDFKISRMNYLGIPQERIALRLVQTRDIIRNHLGKRAELPKSPNADLKRGFTVPQVAQKHACPVGPEDRTGGWPEPLVWSIALEGKDALQRFKELNWGLRTWPAVPALARGLSLCIKLAIQVWARGSVELE